MIRRAGVLHDLLTAGRGVVGSLATNTATSRPLRAARGCVPSNLCRAYHSGCNVGDAETQNGFRELAGEHDERKNVSAKIAGYQCATRFNHHRRSSIHRAANPRGGIVPVYVRGPGVALSGPRLGWRPLSARCLSHVLPQNQNRVHLQSTKDQRSDGFSDVVLMEADSRISKLYEASEKTQNLQA